MVLECFFSGSKVDFSENYRKGKRQIQPLPAMKRKTDNCIKRPLELGKLYVMFKMSAYEVHQIVMLFNYKQIFASMYSKWNGDFI